VGRRQGAAAKGELQSLFVRCGAFRTSERRPTVGRRQNDPCPYSGAPPLRQRLGGILDDPISGLPANQE
jgi:hypothetical protein